MKRHLFDDVQGDGKRACTIDDTLDDLIGLCTDETPSDHVQDNVDEIPVNKIESIVNMNDIHEGVAGDKAGDEGDVDEAIHNSDTEQFMFKTSNLKVIRDIMSIFKEQDAKMAKQMECNIRFSPDGMFVYEERIHATMMHNIHFGTDLFSILRCANIVDLRVNMSVFCKALATLMGVKSETVSFTNNLDGYLLITGGVDSRNTEEVSERGTIVVKVMPFVTPGELPRGLKYDVPLEVNTDVLASCVSAMPPGFFNLSVDAANSRLVFLGDSDMSTIQLFMAIPGDVMATIRNFPDLVSFNERFNRAELMFVTKASSTCSCMTIALGADSAPMFIKLKFSDHKDDDAEATYADVYICSKINEGTDDDDEDEAG